jgi:hypothetical protein
MAAIVKQNHPREKRLWRGDSLTDGRELAEWEDDRQSRLAKEYLMKWINPARCCGRWASVAGAIVLGFMLTGCGATPQPDVAARPAAAAEPVQAEQPAQPQQSHSPAASAVPAEDLVSQADEYVAAIEESLATEDDYKDAREELARNSNTLIVIVWALDGYNQSNKFTGHDVTKAVHDLAAAKDYGAAKQAFGQLKTAFARTAHADGERASTPPASLAQLMKEVPIINTRLKRNIRGDRLKERAKETAGCSAVIAAIAQRSYGSTEAAKTPEQVAQWHKLCVELRDAATAVNAGIHAGDPQATATGMTKLAQSCDDCHAVFHKEKDAGGEK